jgi:hypothetical protein
VSLLTLTATFFNPQDINVPCIKTDNVKEFGDGENTEFETVFVLTDFASPDYSYLYKHDNRIVGPPVVLHCAGREEVRTGANHSGNIHSQSLRDGTQCSAMDHSSQVQELMF